MKLFYNTSVTSLKVLTISEDYRSGQTEMTDKDWYKKTKDNNTVNGTKVISKIKTHFSDFHTKKKNIIEFSSVYIRNIHICNIFLFIYQTKVVTKIDDRCV